MTQKKRILFVCLGNICRSPAAETIFKATADAAKLPVIVDSAGSSGWHEGEPADGRMRHSAKQRGYIITSHSRPFEMLDFNRFDLIVAMDDQNFDNLRNQAVTLEDKEKIVRMADFFIHQKMDHIPDPYYGGTDGFNLVIDLLEDASIGLLNHLTKKEI